MRANPVKVEEYLKGIHYPANKGDLIHQAKENDAPGDVVTTLDRLPDKDYSSPIDVNHELGKFK